MAQLAIAAAGAAVGFVVGGGPVGAQVGWAVGSMVGAQFGPKQKSYGPRLEDLRVTGSEYGQTIPWIAGHPRIAGQVWWASDRREIANTSNAGKGGGATSTEFTYEVDILYGLTNVPIGGITRIWENGKLIYNVSDDATDENVNASANTEKWSRITVYTGDASQLPDPTYEAAVTNAPAYRGRGSVFIESLQLGSSGVIPNLTFEICNDTTPVVSDILLDLDFATGFITDRACSPTVETEIGQGQDDIAGEHMTFVISENSTGSALTQGVGWTNAAQYFDDPVTGWTFELVCSATLTDGANPSQGAYVAYVSEGLTYDTAKAAFIVGIYGSGSVLVSVPFLGNINGSASAAGADVHIAVTYSDATGIDAFVDGVRAGGFGSAPNIAQLTSVVLGGAVIINPSSTQGSVNVSYAFARLTRGVKYTANFTPAGLDPPVCAERGTLVDRTIQSVVEELCDIPGMPVGTYDATDLASITKPVRAFSVAQVSTARSALEQLATAYFFESYVTDKLYFVPRAGSVIDTIDADDLGSGIDSPEDEVLPTNVGSDMELPAQVSLSYANVDADYTTATEHSDRLLSGQVSTSAMQMPMAFTSSEAKGIADAILLDGYASRVSGVLAVPLSYSALVPTDVVTVPDADGNVYRVRLTRRTDTGPVLQFEWVLDDATAVESAGITSEDYTPSVDVRLIGATSMLLMDIPILRDADDHTGHYVAAKASDTRWMGASIQRSFDDVSYYESARINERAIFGTATTVLGDWASGDLFDETNSVTVDVASELSSSTRDAMLVDTTINAMLVGDEVIRFRTATFVSSGVYTLSGLLRGQKGTEWACDEHAIGETVCLLTIRGLRYVNMEGADIGASRYYKGVSIGGTLASAPRVPFTSNAVSMKPRAPVDLRESVDASDNITVTWVRRTRVSSKFVGPAGSLVPVGEASELYEIDVVLVSSGAVLRTYSESSASVEYTAAQQTTDSVDTGTAIRFDVYQISAIVGRGYVASYSTTGAVP